MQSETYEPVSNWPTSSRARAQPSKTQEGWYNMPGTSSHELNMNVSSSQGPAYGPKARVSMSQKLSTKQGIFLGTGIVGLLVVIFLIHRKMKQ